MRDQQPTGVTTSGLDDEDPHAAVRYVIRRLTGLLAPEPIPLALPEMDLLADLAYDSLTLVELSFVLEDAFALEQITREEGRRIHTVGDIEEYIFGKMAERRFMFEGNGMSDALQIVADAESWNEPGED